MTCNLRRLLFAVVLAGVSIAPLHAALPLQINRDGLPSLAPMLKAVTPTVVNISVVQRSPEEQNPLMRDPFFRRFFGLPENTRPQISAGSGVIVDAANGYVLTNHHVIKDAREVVVTLKDNRRVPAKLVGSDAGTDIALLKVESDGLTQARIGDSDALEVGDYVVAIGNPFGIGQTVTSGIVSALGRSGISPEGYEDFIQTDAPINPGNSGGALVNLRGELVGINTAIIGPSGGNVGIGFAVPSNMVRAVMRQLIRHGEVRRGYLGISMQDLTPELATTLGTAVRRGAVISTVAPGSPAEKSGLRAGDIVTGLNGRPIHAAAELRAQLGVIASGEAIELRLMRGGRALVVRTRTENIEARSTADGETIEELAGATFTDAVRKTSRGRGKVIVVASVAPGSPAFEHGLRPGDLVVGFNGKRIGTVSALARSLRGGGRVALSVIRGDFLLTIVIR